MQHELPEPSETGSPYYLDEKTARYFVAGLQSHGNYTLGVLLTAVEASLGESKQAEAMKAIVRREMFAFMDRNQAEAYELSNEQRRGLAPRETRIDGQDEALHVYPKEN